jgi:hypothetical protein
MSYRISPGATAEWHLTVQHYPRLSRVQVMHPGIE